MLVHKMIQLLEFQIFSQDKLQHLEDWSKARMDYGCMWRIMPLDYNLKRSNSFWTNLMSRHKFNEEFHMILTSNIYRDLLGGPHR
jgi:hypothetical protein